MGIEYSAVIVVGYDYPQLKSILQNLETPVDDTWEWLEDENLRRVSTYFDADDHGCIFGLVISESPDYGETQVDLDELADRADKATRKLFRKYGVEPMTYLCPQGT